MPQALSGAGEESVWLEGLARGLGELEDCGGAECGVVGVLAAELFDHGMA